MPPLYSGWKPRSQWMWTQSNMSRCRWRHEGPSAADSLCNATRTGWSKRNETEVVWLRESWPVVVVVVAVVAPQGGQHSAAQKIGVECMTHCGHPSLRVARMSQFNLLPSLLLTAFSSRHLFIRHTELKSTSKMQDKEALKAIWVSGVLCFIHCRMHNTWVLLCGKHHHRGTQMPLYRWLCSTHGLSPALWEAHNFLHSGMLQVNKAVLEMVRKVSGMLTKKLLTSGFRTLLKWGIKKDLIPSFILSTVSPRMSMMKSSR